MSAQPNEPAVLQQRPVFSFAPAKPGSPGVYDLRVIAKTADIPAHECLATDKWPDLVTSNERDVITALLVRNGEVVLLWTNRAVDRNAIASVQSRLRQHDLRVTEVVEAPSTLLQVFKGRSKVKSELTIMPVSEGAMPAMFQSIVRQAFCMGASDIHLQVGRQFADLQMRVHGEMRSVRSLHRDEAEALSRAIFAAAEQDSKPVTFNSRACQDAAIDMHFMVASKEVHLKLRYGSMPVYPDGWDIVLRLLPMGQDGMEASLEQLGFDAGQMHDLQRMLSRPIGAIMLCGGTGSGKSTTIQTLCGMLFDRFEGKRLIRSIEDPPEYRLRGVRQTPVVRSMGDSSSDGKAFSKALHAAMRCNPDMLMIGEIRDEETARLAQQAVQTGHKVLSTIHAGTPFFVYDRLIDLGVERTVATADQFISGIIHQYLIPEVCPHCALPIDEVGASLPADLFARINRTSGQHLSALRFRGPGCAECSNEGLIGRTVVASMLVPDREIQNYMLMNNRIAAEAYWRAGGGSTGAHSAKTAGRTALDQAIGKMHKGRLSPIAVELALGFLDDQRTPDQEREWLRLQQGEGASRTVPRGGHVNV